MLQFAVTEDFRVGGFEKSYARQAVFHIHDILMWIRIRGSMLVFGIVDSDPVGPKTCGSGSGHKSGSGTLAENIFTCRRPAPERWRRRAPVLPQLRISGSADSKRVMPRESSVPDP